MLNNLRELPDKLSRYKLVLKSVNIGQPEVKGHKDKTELSYKVVDKITKARITNHLSVTLKWKTNHKKATLRTLKPLSQKKAPKHNQNKNICILHPGPALGY